MATNRTVWIENINAGVQSPFIMLGKFKVGSSQAIARGEILELTGDANTTWVPIDSDFVMDSNIAVANEEIKTGDRAGYYEIIIPRPGDVFKFLLAAAGATAVGTALYFSDSETVTVSAGTTIMGRSRGQDNYPLKQGHTSDDASIDNGTTIRSVSTVQMVFTETASYYSAIQTG